MTDENAILMEILCGMLFGVLLGFFIGAVTDDKITKESIAKQLSPHSIVKYQEIKEMDFENVLKLIKPIN